MQKHWYVYIMNNKKRGLYIFGMTDDLEERVKEHKLKLYPKSFTAKYNCDKLIYFEESEKGVDAETRERQFKKWKREWKVELIEEMNPNWSDLSINWNINYNKTRIKI